MKCLVVEDNASNRDIIGHLLTHAGHQIEFAPSGASGLEAARSTLYDIIFLDLHMPGMSGWEVLDSLQQSDGAMGHAPIVILSAVTDTASIASAKSKGAAGYLRKPISPFLLLDTLERVGLKAQDARSTAAEISVDEDDEASSPLSSMRALTTAPKVGHFLETCLKGIEQGMAGIELTLERNDVAAALELLHALTNEFHNVALPAGAKACRELASQLRSGEACAASLNEVRLRASEAISSIMREPEYPARRA